MSSKRMRPGPLAALLLLAVPAWADDASTGVVPGPFRAEPAGGAALTSAQVVLDGEQVRVALTVTLRGTASIRLDLPRFAWLGEAETYPDRQFPELKVDVDGRPASPAEQVVATAKGKDITPSLRAAGIDPFAIAETPPFVEAAPGKQAALDALVASGAATKAPEGLLANWSASRTVRIVPGAGAHELAFRYTARPAFALSTPAAADVRWPAYCTTLDAAKRVLARHGLRGAIVTRQYGIPVALDGVRPRALTLRVSKQAGAATIVCGAGGKALIDPAGEVAVKAGADGAVHVLRLVPPG